MYLKLSHNDIVYNSEFLIKDYSLKEIYYNNLNQADNSCNLTIPYDVEIQNFINLYSDSNIKGQIIDGENIIWTGYLRKNYNFGKKQRNTELKIELVSPSYLLNTKTQEYFVLQNTNLGLAVQTLLSKAGFTSTVELTEEIGLFQIQPDTDIKKALTDLLFSYGYCFDFDNEGNFIVFPLFNKPETFTQTFDGNNCIDEIKVSKKEQSYNATSVEWELVEKVLNKLIFADTTGGNNETNSCSITIQPGEYLGEVDSVGTYYIQYDCAEGKILNVTEGTLTIESTNNSGLTYSYNNLGNQGELSIYNNSSSPITITKLVVYGDAFVVKSTNFAKSSTGTNFKDLKSDYIHNKTFAENLAKNYTDWLNYADYTVNLKSYTDFALGSFVTVTENGLGTIQGRIIEKIYNIKNEPIQYQIEAISEYEPAEVNSYTKKQSSLLVKGIMGKDGKDGLNGSDGKDGINGTNGKDGISISIDSTSVDYQSSVSGTEIPTGAWLNYIPSVANGNYLWCRTTVNYSDGTKTESYSVSYIPTNGTNGTNGKDGKDGKDAVSIKTITEYYLASASNSGVTTSTTGWTESIQTVSSSKKYLWNYEKINFSDNSSTSTSPVIIGNYAANGTNGTNGKDGANGKDGLNGSDGKGIKSITEHYLATSSSSGITISSSGWTTTVQTMTATKKYLWNYETVTYTDDSSTNTSPSIIGVYGDKGQKGDTGSQGPKGATGATGATGPQGPQGAKGNTGVSMRNKGTWASGTAYVNNDSYIDVVYYASNGCSYACIKSHTASSSILPTNTTYWSLIAKKGETGPRGSDGTSYWVSKSWVDVSSLNTNTWYPVVGSVLSSEGVQNLRCTVQLNSGTKPAWSTHSQGFSVEFEVQDQKSGWGTTPATCIKFIDNFNWTQAVSGCSNQSPVSYTQMTNSSLPVFYLRGGGKYLIETTYSCSWSVQTSTYTSNSQSVSPSANTRPSPRGTYVVGAKGDKGDKGDKGATGATGATGPQGVRGAEYRGAFSSNPTSSLVNGDWYLKTGDGYCYYYTSSNSTWNKITSYSDYRYTQAMSDMINLSATLTSNTNLKTAVNAWVQNLVAGTALIEKLFAKSISVGNEIKSSNYSAGSSGFRISSDGNAEFNSGRFRGGLGEYKQVKSWLAHGNSATITIPYNYGITLGELTLTMSYSQYGQQHILGRFLIGKADGIYVTGIELKEGEIYNSNLSITTKSTGTGWYYKSIEYTITNNTGQSIDIYQSILKIA